MLIRKCDRCGKEIKDSEKYWIINIREIENTTMQIAPRESCKAEHEYCKNCTLEIMEASQNIKD